MWESGIFEAECVGKISIPLLVLRVSDCQSSACEPFSGRVEGIHHIARQLRELAHLIQEDHRLQMLLCAWASGQVTVFIGSPSRLVESFNNARPCDVGCSPGKLR